MTAILDDELLTQAQVARLLGLSPASVPRARREGRIPPPALWLSANAPRWSTAEMRRHRELMLQERSAEEATATVMAERAARIAALSSAA